MTDNVPDKPRDPMQEFREKITSKIRSDIGELMPQEVIDEVVKQALHNLLFEKEQEWDGYRTQTKPHSWFEREVKTRLEEQCKTQVRVWLDQNEELVREHVARAITEGLPELIIDHISKAIIGGGAGMLDAHIEKYLNKVRFS